MNRLWHAWLTLRLGVPALVWLVLALTLALMVAGQWLERAQSALTVERNALHRQVARLPPPRPSVGADPARASRESRLARVFVLLDQMSLHSRQVRYRYDAKGTMTMDLNLRASYPQIRTLAARLGDEPGIHLARITLERAAPDHTSLSVALQISCSEGQV